MSIYTDEEKQTLLKIAHASINNGFIQTNPANIKPFEYGDKLQQERACFVTIAKKGALRGCIGSLVAHRPLAMDVAANAYAAAFRDPRFISLTLKEYENDGISLHISVLSMPEPMIFNSEEDLLKQIRPGIDGLILSDGGHCGTFLPSVWEQLPTVDLFFAHLKNKAGLPTNYWSNTIQIERYTTEMIE